MTDKERERVYVHAKIREERVYTLMDKMKADLDPKNNRKMSKKEVRKMKKEFCDAAAGKSNKSIRQIYHGLSNAAR